MKQTQVDYAQLAQQLLSADKSNNRLEITALVQTFADVVARIAVARVHYLRDGELVASPTGATHVVKPAYDRAIEKHIADYYQRFMTVRPNNLRVAAGEIEDDGRGRLVVHHTGRRV